MYSTGNIALEKIKKIVEAKGVDTSKPAETIEEREARRKRETIEFQRLLNQQRDRERYLYSLWPNDKPLRFTFKDWKPKLQPNEALGREVGVQAYNLTKQLQDKNHNVVMWGKPGTGKTSLALAMLQELMANEKSGMFVSTSELAYLFRLKITKKDVEKKLDKVLGQMKEADVVILDDFGTEGGIVSRVNGDGYKGVNIELQEAIYRVANARFDQQGNTWTGSMIITTNNSREELERMYDGKILSRLIPKEPAYMINFSKLTDVRGRG